MKKGVDETLRTLLFDPQTAGGLLISVAGSSAEKLASALTHAGVKATRIGEILPDAKPLIKVW